MTAQNLQPSRVPSLRTLPGSEADVAPRPQQQLKGRIDPVNIAVVGNHDESTSSYGQRGRGRHGYRGRPVERPLLAGQSQPRRRRSVTCGHVPQE